MKKKLIVLTLLNLSLFADPTPHHPTSIDSSSTPSNTPIAWTTGPLVGSSSSVTGYGQFSIQPYINFTTYTGAYNKHWHSVSAEHNFFTLNTQLYFYTGLNSYIDIGIAPQFFYNSVSNKNGVAFGDLPLILDVQFLDYTTTGNFPGILLSISEIFPTGPYQRLNPSKLYTDQAGFGTYSTNFSLIFYQIYHLGGHHFLSTSSNLSYTLNTPVKVHGFNAYGGGYGTNGTVLPGRIAQAIISFQFTLTQNWAIALDTVYTQISKTKFFGNPGLTDSNSIARMSLPSAMQISFAPAIEYNFSGNIGLIAGCWFSAWGKNSFIFRSGIISLTCSI